MTTRSRNILRLLASNTGYTTIEKIAETTGAGVRTIHRDLEGLERSLGLQGVRIERKRGHGVRLIDQLPEKLAQDGTAVSATYESGQRPLLALVYLIVAGGWIKLSELAHALYVSDSTVSSDLTNLETILPGVLSIERQKGIGIRLLADEVSARLAFLSSFPPFFPPYLLMLDDTLSKKESSTEERLIRIMGIRKDNRTIREKVGNAEKIIGHRFSPSSFGLLYGYLFLLQNRLPVVGLLSSLPSFRLPVPDLYQNGARAMIEEELATLSSSRRSIDAEILLLARILASCEIATLPIASVTEYLGRLAPEVDAVVERSLVRLEKKETVWLHDDRSLLNYLRMTIVAAARRIDLGIPEWREFGLRAFPDLEETPESAILVDQFLSELGTKLSFAKPSVVRREIQEASFALSAHVQTLQSRHATDITVKILCYEGLGLSQFVLALAREIFPRGANFDSRWEPDFGSTSKPGQYDLVISTFPLNIPGTRHLLIDGEGSPAEIRRQLREVVDDFEIARGSLFSAAETNWEPPSEPELSLTTVMSVINSFFVETRMSDTGLLEQAVAALDRGDCDPAGILRDLERRESYGVVLFEEMNVQLLHCRTDGIPEPRAGVIQSKTNEPTVLVLAAPIEAPQAQTHALSEIVIALNEYADFPNLLAIGTREEIRARLLILFGHRVG